MDVRIAGVIIGTASESEFVDDISIQFYDAVPIDGMKIPEGTWVIDYENGILEVYSAENDNLVFSTTFGITIN